MKICTVCGEEKDESFFYQAPDRRDNSVRLMSFCKECHKDKSNARVAAMSSEQRALYYEAMRARKLLRSFGLTIEDFDRMFEDQCGVCAICHQPETTVDNRWAGAGVRVRRLSVDHDHVTGQVRGLLCMKCNTRLGYFEKYGLYSALLAYVEGEKI